jgi:hypothetical protein
MPSYPLGEYSGRMGSGPRPRAVLRRSTGSGNPSPPPHEHPLPDHRGLNTARKLGPKPQFESSPSCARLVMISHQLSPAAEQQAFSFGEYMAVSSVEHRRVGGWGAVLTLRLATAAGFLNTDTYSCMAVGSYCKTLSRLLAMQSWH